MILEKEEYAQVALLAAENGATDEQVGKLIRICEDLAIGAGQLDMILGNHVEVASWDEDDNPRFKPREKPPVFMKDLQMTMDTMLFSDADADPTTIDS